MKISMFRSLVAATLLAFAGSANAAVIATDDFSYPDGPLVPNGGWISHSGTAGTLAVASGAAVVSQDSGSEDAHLQFTEYTSGKLTAEFDIVVDAVEMTGTDFEYFAHFMLDGSTSEFTARVDVQTPNGAGDYTLGVSPGSGFDVALATDFAFGAVVPVSVTYDFATGLATLSAGGDSVTTVTTGFESALDSFALRQSNSSSDETILVDNLVISYVPEPGTFVLVLLGFVAAGFVRMRTKLG